MEVSKKPFGLVNGLPVNLYTLASTNGVKVMITNYGATVVELWVPDRQGVLGDVTLGFDSAEDYVSEVYKQAGPYFGAVIGRYGNRIANARFELDGRVYQLAANNGLNSLHGGLKGFDKVIWQAKEMKTADAVGLECTYVSKDGEEGFPGNLEVKVCYWVTDGNEFKIEYQATADKATPCNLTNHAYFNLSAMEQPDILEHELTLFADTYTEINEGLIATGKLPEVTGTPMDFRVAKRVGEQINTDWEQLNIARGYDHNWVLNKVAEGEMSLAATVYEPRSGRYMEVFTTEPGVQFYAGNFLDGTLVGKGGKVYGLRAGLCLETQHYPDSPNQPGFPSTTLRPDEVYKTSTVYKFGVR